MDGLQTTKLVAFLRACVHHPFTAHGLTELIDVCMRCQGGVDGRREGVAEWWGGDKMTKTKFCSEARNDERSFGISSVAPKSS